MRKILLLLLASASFSVNAKSVVPYDMLDIDCLAMNLYHEGRGEKNRKGLIAIGFVTLQRVKNPHWPNSVCKVVYEQRLSKKTNKWVPMFSWTLDGKSDIPRNFEIYNHCLIIARVILAGKFKDPTHNSTHYHSNKVNPYWSASLNKVASIGNHIFYK